MYNMLSQLTHGIISGSYQKVVYQNFDKVENILIKIIQIDTELDFPISFLNRKIN